MNSHGDGLSYPTSTDQTGGRSYDAMGDTSTANRLDVHPTDKLIDAQSSLNNHHPQPHLELENGQLIPSSDVIVNVEVQPALATKTVIDMIGDQSRVPQTQSETHLHHSKDANGCLAIELDKIV